VPHLRHIGCWDSFDIFAQHGEIPKLSAEISATHFAPVSQSILALDIFIHR
jgi:hypothetical protein